MKVQPLQLALAGGILALAIAYGYGASGLPEETGYAGVGARFYPVLISIALMVVAVLLGYQSITGGFRGFEPEAAPERSWAGGAYVSAGLLLHAVLITKIGFVLSGTLLFILVARGFGSRNLLRDFATGILLTLPVFWLFTRALDVSLPALVKPWI
jgi:putative tricarboxylic transport membrane protein